MYPKRIPELRLMVGPNDVYGNNSIHHAFNNISHYMYFSKEFSFLKCSLFLNLHLLMVFSLEYLRVGLSFSVTVLCP